MEVADMSAASEPILLIVDDDKNNVLSLEKVFTKEGMRVITATDPKIALELVRSHEVSVLLSDLMMPTMDGVELLRAAKAVSPGIEVVLMTAYGNVETAVDAMKAGANHFVEKPFKRADIVRTVGRALEKHELIAENRTLRAKLSSLEKRSIVGSSPEFRKTFDMAMQAAPSHATVLLLGESGTGKELMARAVHEASSRPKGPFIAVNCAALPETIMEAELFGYEKGAFTGAVSRREGRFRQASGGTIFLDEVGEISLSVQVKLLRVLQESEFEPLGGKTEKADVRVIAATNRDLEEEVKRGGFREDLFYRLNVIVITLPPLRRRRDDIPLLAEHFLARHAARNGKNLAGFTKEALALLCGYCWPGNVRELENVVERAVVLCRGDVLGVEDLPERVAQGERLDGQLVFSLGSTLEEVELRMIRETLRHTGGDKKLAAQILGIAPRTIYRKLDLLAEDE
jgi:two-component system response regulator HydG